ncbi:hypothetical protein CHS0354_006632 [Potamilus streckersoni]|uniref:Uncharacterized protein n=1 Tax=Potamilus streckersoni TaxID=2493646 RepID=A0AAE0W2B9_9BIVA|nr:hypothetical protein CHS0354_006632 [Potamilus streckersoni]
MSERRDRLILLQRHSPNYVKHRPMLRNTTPSRTLAILECPTVLLGSFSYSYTDGSTSICGNGNEVWDGCTDTKSMTFNYTMCSTRIAYSAIGTVRCIVSFTSGTYSFATVYNTDLLTDESTTYLFTCMMASKSGSKVSVSLSPKSCTPTQTPDTVPVNATGSTLGANMTLTPYSKLICPHLPHQPHLVFHLTSVSNPTTTTTTSITVTSTTNINTSTATATTTTTTTTTSSGGGSSTKNTVVDLTIIIAVSVVAGLLLVILIAVVFYMACIRKSKNARTASATRSEMQKKQETKTSKKSEKAKYGKRSPLSQKSNLPDVCEPVLEENKLNGVVRAMEEDMSYFRSKASVDKTPTNILSSPQNMIRVQSADYPLSEFEDDSLPATPRTPRRDSSNIIPFRENPEDVSSKFQRGSESEVSQKGLQGEKEKKAMSLFGSVQNDISGQTIKDQSMEHKTSMKTGNNADVTDKNAEKIKDKEQTSLAKSVEQGGQSQQEITKKTGKESPHVNNTVQNIANDFKTPENSVDENKRNTSSSEMTNESETAQKSNENKKILTRTSEMGKEPSNPNPDAKSLDTLSSNVTQAKEVDIGHTLQSKDENEQMIAPSKQNPDLNAEAVTSTPGKAIYAVNTGPQRKKNSRTPTKRSKSHKKNAKQKTHKDAKGDKQLILLKGRDGQDNVVDERDKGNNFAKAEHQQVESDKKEESPSSNNQVSQVGDSNQINTKAISPEPASSLENVVPPLLFQQIQENEDFSEKEHDHVETNRTGFTTDSELDCGGTEEEDIFDDAVIGNLLSSISDKRSRLNSLEAASRASSKLTRTPTGISIGLIGFKEGTGFFPELPTHYETGQPPTNSFFLTKMSTDPPK